jgi:hypothetical protein
VSKIYPPGKPGRSAARALEHLRLGANDSWLFEAEVTESIFIDRRSAAEITGGEDCISRRIFEDTSSLI